MIFAIPIDNKGDVVIGAAGSARAKSPFEKVWVRGWKVQR
jgi:hypothetical protein